ncbi:MAG TPA: COX15/CtaA family protein [Terriglobales bacterium]|nr:COX15/CtaA family protein [Terriglobales bacterium]
MAWAHRAGCPRDRRRDTGATQTCKEPILKAVALAYNRTHHQFALFTACATFLLIVAGALVTSNDAGLSVPDWPTSFGSLYKIPHLVGGVRFEHTHRMIAQFVGFLSIVLAIWTWRADHRRWMKYLGVTAVGLVIAQGILGGLTVLFYLPPAISSAHAVLAQTFFCVAVLIATFTGRRWVEEAPNVQITEQRPRLFTLTLLSIFALYVQLILGALFRHHGLSWGPHVVNAGIVAIVLCWTVVRALSQCARVDALRRPAITMLSLLITQLCLGFIAFLTRVAWGRDAVQPELPMVIATVTHVAVGALLLATAVVLAVQVLRHAPVALAERVPSREGKPVAA